MDIFCKKLTLLDDFSCTVVSHCEIKNGEENKSVFFL